MRAPKSNSFLFILTLILTVAMAVVLFGSAPQQVQAQDIATPTPEVQIQIVGGQLADPGEWPWQVALIGRDAPLNDFWSGPGWQFCGGSLIDPQWVLTAAHCITEDNGTVTPASTIDVVAGVYNLRYPTAGFQRREVIQIVRHTSYNKDTFYNDIALLKLSSPITIGGSGATKTALVPLVPANIGPLVGEYSWVTGWGNTSATTEDYPQQLHEVTLPIMTNSTCNNSLHYGGAITSNMMCAGYDAGGLDACQGDSGGPLVVNNAGQWNLAGIVSWGDGCGLPLSPGVYTRVSQYVDWVNQSVDLVPPVVIGSIRANANPANTASVGFTVTFSESVTGVNTGDFALSTTDVSGATVSGVGGTGSVYTVTVNTGTGSGTIHLNVVDNDSIIDANSKPLGGSGSGNGSFTSGETYDVDKTAPTISSITRASSDPTASPLIDFLVTFSESVTGVDTSDFVLNTTSLAGATVSSVNGSGATRTVTVNTGSGDGTIRLDAIDNNSIIDQASNPLNGGFTSGDIYTVNKPDLPAPDLRSPRSNVITNDTTPTFWWTTVRGGETYQIQFATNIDFTGANSHMVNDSSYTANPPFVGGNYFWRVRAYNVANQPGAWSSVRTFEIDTTGPAAPVLSLPDNGISPLRRTPTFKWSSVLTAVLYEFQYTSDSDPGFSNPIYTVAVRNTFRKPPAMAIGTYRWHVRAKDAAGNWGAWSAHWTINIIAP